MIFKAQSAFWSKFINDKGMDISDRGNGVSKMAYIKHSKDNVLLSKSKKSYNDNS